jgi:hypothetical protein
MAVDADVMLRLDVGVGRAGFRHALSSSTGRAGSG